MFNPIGLNPSMPGANAPIDPRIQALQQIKQLLGQAGANTPGGLRQVMQQLAPEERQALKQLMAIARGGVGGPAGPQSAGLGHNCAPPPMCGSTMPSIPPGGPMMLPMGGMPMDNTIPMTRGDAVASKVQDAGDRLEAATGIRIPTQIIDDGQKNGTAFGDYNTVHTGINPDAAPGVKFHEDAHILNGDTTNPQGTTMQRELRADQTAGYLLVKAGYGEKEVGAFINEVMGLAGGDHGTPDQRATAVVMGVNQALAEQGLPPIG